VTGVNDGEFIFDRDPDGTVELRGSSPARLAELLERLESTLRATGVDTAAMLAPGISSNDLTRVLEPLCVRANEELEVWFGWHNGQYTPLNDGPALPFFVPSSAEDAVDFFLNRVPREDGAVGSADGPLACGFERGWVPLAWTFIGYSIEGGTPVNGSPRVRFTSPEWGEPGTERLYKLRSLCTLVAWWLVGLDAGAYKYDPTVPSWSDDPTRLPATMVQAACA
jgi:hypothetical protein